MIPRLIPLLLLAAALHAAPQTAVYRWGQGGCVKGLYDQYEQHLGGRPVWALDFTPNESWDKIEGQDWQLGTWSKWVRARHGRRLILSVPLLPGPWNRSGDGSGPVSLQAAAQGRYNQHFRRLAQNLVRHHLADTIIRPGWEFNGGWYTFRATTPQDAQAYAAAFRQLVQTMRRVSGARFSFCWNPALERHWNYHPELAWPGDDAVDIIGLDVYDQSWLPDTYPIPPDASPQETRRRQRRVWHEQINNPQNFGLPWWTAFARRHRKPLALVEWGLCIRQDRHGGGDNPYFIEQIARFVKNPANNLLFHCYFDICAPDGDHQLVAPTRFPNSAQTFLNLFANP